MSTVKKRNKTVAGILAIFFGTFGLQYIYLGMYGKAIACIAFCWLFVPTIIGVIVGIMYLLESEENFDARYGYYDVSNSGQPGISSQEYVQQLFAAEEQRYQQAMQFEQAKQNAQNQQYAQTQQFVQTQQAVNQQYAQQQQAPQPAGKKYCTNCGALLQPGQKFCTSCGQSI